MKFNPQVPGQLAGAILSGDCVAFVGAGFSAAGGLPDWKSLLENILAEATGINVVAEYIHGLISHGTAHALDEAAQALEDAMGREPFNAALKQHLSVAEVNSAMRQRIERLKGIPFCTVLTTNFDTFLDGSVPNRSTYRQALRSEHFSPWGRRYRPEGGGAFTVKLHGDLGASVGDDFVVITRRDYRRRLYSDSAYSTFLRGMLATSTVLYLGFSFEDAYLNELRSEILSLVGHSAEDEVTSYAVMNDVPEQAIAHFRRHEGIEILSYDTEGGADYSGFDVWLEAIYRETNAVVRFGNYLKERRILWLDPNPSNNTEAFEFLKQAAGASGRSDYAVETVPDVEQALSVLQNADVGGRFHLLITHWGDSGSGREDQSADPTAVAVLRAIRQRDIRVPVIVFASHWEAEERKEQALAMGAADYCFTFESLFTRLESVFAPVVVTG